MDWLLLVTRVVHVGSAMIWFGGAIISSFFLDPTAAALGKPAQPFMDHLMTRRRMGVFFPIVADMTVLCGAPSTGAPRTDSRPPGSGHQAA